jgi:dihydroxyacetone kinase-like protein
VDAGADVARATAVAALAARTGAEATAGMTAKHGRARFAGERSRGMIDAGAASVALMMDTLAVCWKGDANGQT